MLELSGRVVWQVLEYFSQLTAPEGTSVPSSQTGQAGRKPSRPARRAQLCWPA